MAPQRLAMQNRIPHRGGLPVAAPSLSFGVRTMKYRALLTMLVLLPLMAACGGKNDGSENVSTPSAETAPAAEGSAASTTDTAAPANPAGDNAAQSTPADGAAPAASAPVVPPEGPAPVLGKDYVEIPNGQPYAPLNGK